MGQNQTPAVKWPIPKTRVSHGKESKREPRPCVVNQAKRKRKTSARSKPVLAAWLQDQAPSRNDLHNPRADREAVANPEPRGNGLDGNRFAIFTQAPVPYSHVAANLRGGASKRQLRSPHGPLPSTALWGKRPAACPACAPEPRTWSGKIRYFFPLS